MFDLIAGLPLHPLVVHGVVVLLPLAALGTVAVAAVPAWRRRFGVLVALLATAATALVPVATRSGEALQRRVGPPAGDHATLGGQLLWYALPLAVLVWLLVLADARTRAAAPSALSRGPGAAARGVRAPDTPPAPGVRSGPPAARPGRALVTALAVLAVVAALAALVQVYRVGDSGARSVWGDVAAVQIR